MLTFEKVLELTYVEQKVSKSGNVYIVVRFITENGSTMDCVYKGATPIQNLELRSNYKFVFEYSINGRYSSFNCLSLEKVK